MCSGLSQVYCIKLEGGIQSVSIQRVKNPNLLSFCLIYFFLSEKIQLSLPARRIGSADSCRHGVGHMTYRERKEAEKKFEEDKTRAERMKILEVS